MKMWLIALLLISALSLVLAGALMAFQGQPRCTALDPDTAKTGDTVNATCENVDKSSVANLYLTDGKDDTKIAVMANTAEKITFQVPRVKPGRYHIAFMSANKSSIVEQPIVLTVE
jgi:hypothetical protein